MNHRLVSSLIGGTILTVLTFLIGSYDGYLVSEALIQFVVNLAMFGAIIALGDWLATKTVRKTDA